MLMVISGGSGSGKSEFAENMAVKLKKSTNAKKLIYIATMLPFGQETLKKIERHKKMRAKKDFTTIECYNNLKDLKIDNDCVVLLECMSNLMANEIFNQNNKDAVYDINLGVQKICQNSKALIIVTNEIFSDGVKYDDSTMDYLKKMGQINCLISENADFLVEVVYGIPIYNKGEFKNAD